MKRFATCFLAASLAAASASAQPGVGVGDTVWFLSASGQLYEFDRFGLRRQIVNAAGTAGPFRAPNGETWIGVGAGMVFYRTDGQIAGGASASGPVTDVAFDTTGTAWVANSGQPVLEQFGLNGQLLFTVNLPQPAHHVDVGNDGAVWAAQRAQPQSLLSRLDPVSFIVGTTSLPASIGDVVDIEVDFRGPGASHVFCIGNGSNELVEVDGRNNVVAVTPLADAATRLDPSNIAITVDGSVWVATRQGLLRFSRATRRVSVAFPGACDQVALDARGDVWIRHPLGGRLYRVDVERRRLDVPAGVTGGLPVAAFDDPAMHRFLYGTDGLGDADGDTYPNAAELQIRSNPIDPQSNPLIDLRTTRVGHLDGEQIVYEINGLGGAAVLLFAPGLQLSQPPIAGIVGTPRLPLGAIFPVTAVVAVPSQLRLTIPVNASLQNALLCAQPLLLSNPFAFGNEACVRIDGRTPQRVVETFQNDQQLDKAVSSGSWANGQGRPGRIGGSGVHGSFDHTLGDDLGGGVWEWNTDDTTIPATHTLFGDTRRVTDGRFEFTDFRVPAGVTVRFVGSKPAVVRVRGNVDIQGTIDVGAADVPSTHNGRNSQVGPPFVPGPGQDGGTGGPFGGRGGAGAFGCDGTGNPNQAPFNDFAGFDGEDVRLPAGHAYAGRTPGTGGRGSPLFPAHGDTAQLTYRWLRPGTYAGHTTSGGGGGGFATAGSAGSVVNGGSTNADPTVNTDPNEMGPPTPGGISFNILPRPAGAVSLDHFSAGGSGGGGGGSHPVFADTTAPFKWWSGGAGAGGGGVIALRVGRDLTTGSSAAVVSRGGSGDNPIGPFDIGTRGVPAPGGGGAGGTLLLQVAGAPSLSGLLDVRGGAGIPLDLRPPSFFLIRTFGGDGSPGYYRLEVPQQNPPPGLIGNANPPPTQQNVGTLTDTDSRVAFQSRFYPTGQALPPRFLHYTLRVRIAGTLVTYSDDPSNFNPANRPGLPVRLWLQGRNAGGAAGPWRDFANGDDGRQSINLDLATGFRFMVVFDRAVQSDVVIEELAVDFR